MRVAFYINGFPEDRLYDTLEYGNPGIGGTQYMFWLVSSALALRNNNIEVSLYTTDHISLIPAVRVVNVRSFSDALDLSEQDAIDYLVIRGNITSCDERALSCHSVKVVTWSHNFESPEFIRIGARVRQIVANVCVGYEQYDRLRDTDLFSKALVIPNCIDCALYGRFINENRIDSRRVTYLGSIVPAKGFHRLARVWPNVLKRVPDAQLRIIGSGSFYAGQRRKKLGPLGIASEEYEKSFFSYISENGKLMPSVEHMGSLGGLEKIKTIADSAVGVINPTGRSETFCIVASEFESLEVPVVAPAHFGCLDTVQDMHTGILFQTDAGLVNGIVRLLSDFDLNTKLGKQGCAFTSEKFDISAVIVAWETFLFDGPTRQMKPGVRNVNMRRDGKWLREANRRVKQIPGLRHLPSCVEFEGAAKRLRRYING